jgi:hypothetical protein
MMPSLRLREYVEAGKSAQQRAHREQNPHAKQILQEIERSYYRLAEIEKWTENWPDRPQSKVLILRFLASSHV